MSAAWSRFSCMWVSQYWGQIRTAVLEIDSPLIKHKYHKGFVNKYCILFPCLGKIFEQFVKTRIREEYKEKKNKLLLAKEEFKKLLEESKLSPRYGIALWRFVKISFLI